MRVDSNDSFLGCAKYIYFIGESHCLPYRNVLFRPSLTDDISLCRVRFIQVLASRFSNEAGTNLHGDILTALQGEQLIDNQGAPTHLANDRQASRVAEVSGITAISPPIVLFAGDLDVFGLLRQMGAGYDFELPEDPGYGVNRALEPIQFSILHDQLTKAFQPLLMACKILKEKGFNQLIVHSLPPRVRDTAKQAWSGVLAESQVRAKLTLLANRILQDACNLADIAFIDIWDNIIDEGGYLLSEYALDGIHLNRSAALISLQNITAKIS